MGNLNNVYKMAVLKNTKENSNIVKEMQQKREEYIKNQIQTMYPEQDEEIINKILEKEIGKIRADSPVIDIRDTDKVKSLEDFINETLEIDRETVIEVGESLKELIENVGKSKEESSNNQSIEDFARSSVEDNNSNELNQASDLDKEELIQAKYFVINLGDGKNSKQLVVDIKGNDVGEINDGIFEMNDEYFNSILEKYNIDDFISQKVHGVEELQRVRQELKPKTLEQLSQMNLDSGKEILEEANKTIEEVKNKPKTQDKEVRSKTDNDEVLLDEEDNKNEIEELDEISSEKNQEKMKNFLDSNSVRKLTILLPYTLTDQLDNHELKDRGEEITVYQLKGTVKPIFVLEQGDRFLYGGKYNEQIQKNMAKIPYTSGVIKEVSDEETTADVKLADGTQKKLLVKGEPHDINQKQKEEVVAKIEKLSDELNRIMEITTDDIVDFKIEFPGGVDEKCNRIDQIEMEIYKTCSEYGIVPPVEVKTQAMENTEPEEIDEEKENEENDGWTRGERENPWENN